MPSRLPVNGQDAEGKYITNFPLERKILEYWKSGSSVAIVGKAFKLSPATIKFIVTSHGFDAAMK